MPFNANSRILLTGGTGSFGKAFIAATLKRFPDLERLMVYSRDELKQWELQQLFPADQYPQLRFFWGMCVMGSLCAGRWNGPTQWCMQRP